MLGHELFVYIAALNDVIGDVVEDRQIGLGGEDHVVVSKLEATVLEGRQHMDTDIRIAETTVG